MKLIERWSRPPILMALLAIVVGEVLVLRRMASLSEHSHPPPEIPLGSLESSTASEIGRLRTELRPTEQSDWLRLASVYRAFGVLPGAEYCFHRASQIAPLSEKAEFDWAVTQSRLGLFEDAESRLRSLRERDFDKAECALLLGRDALRQGKVDLAENWLGRSTSPLAVEMLSRLLIHEGRAEEALQVLAPKLELSNPPLHVLQLASWAEDERGNQARKEELRLKALYVQAPVVRRSLAQKDDLEIRLRHGSDGAYASARESLESDLIDSLKRIREVFRIKGDRSIALPLAEVYLAEEKSSEAASVLAELIDQIGPSARAYLLLGRIADHAGNKEQAVQHWNRGLELGAGGDRDVTIALLKELRTLKAAGGDAEAEQRLGGRILYETARLAFHKGDFRKAHQEFLRVLHAIPDHTPTMFYLGEIARIHGQRDTAIKAYRTCLRENPNHGRAQERLAMLEGASE